jgi:hypothetical protein
VGKVLRGTVDSEGILVGRATFDEDKHPTLSEALESAAGVAMDLDPPLIRRGTDDVYRFRVAYIDVELGNQHPRTMSVGVTAIGPGGSS